MSTALTVQEERKQALHQLRDQLARREDDFKAALPAHIPVERFMRVVNTAIASNPSLITCDRASLFSAAMRCAQDGLLPDGRDAALVPFGNQVQYLPMIGGILKKIRNSGELKSVSAHVAYERDTFFYRLGDDEEIKHEPYLEGDRGKAILAYAIAHTKDGGIYREVMPVAEIEKVRAVSRSATKADSPWTKWWSEMARKTVLRRLAKRLPMSTDLDDLLRRDDALYDLDGAKDVNRREGARLKLVSQLDAIAAGPAGPSEDAAQAAAGEEDQRPADEIEDASAEAADDGGEATDPDPRDALLMELREVAGGGAKKLKLRLAGLPADKAALLSDQDRASLAAWAEKVGA